MKIDLSTIDTEQFMIHQHILDGQIVHLVQPQHVGCRWSQANKIFRSSVWDSDGALVSAGFPKFTNWGENPDNFPVPTSLEGATIVEKVDGSLLIVSKWFGKFILRTRGTVDASKLDNGWELDIFKNEILPKLDAFWSQSGRNVDLNCWDSSLLFEWVSPNQRIILNYGDQPKWYFVGLVGHENYSLATQDRLNWVAENVGLERPPTYTFPSIEALMQNVEAWKGKEGVCVYSGKYHKSIHKVKGLWYLALHRMKKALASIDKVIDVWFEQGHPSYQKMQEFVCNQFDWELWTQVQGDVSRICDAWKDVEKIVSGIDTFVETTLRPLPTRRDQAQKVLSSYGQTNRASFVFKRLDGKALADDDLKKLLYQVMKK